MSERLLRVEEVAEILALKPSTIRKLISLRRIPNVKVGRCVRVRETDVEAIMRLGHPGLKKVGNPS